MSNGWGKCNKNTGEIDVLADFTFSKILLFYQNKKNIFLPTHKKKGIKRLFHKV